MPAKLTLHSWLVGAVGCAGGISFGYEPPIVSGLIVQPAFLQFFSNSSSSNSSSSHGPSYCKLHSIELQLYISGLFIAAAAATATTIAGVDRLGRRRFIIAGAALILAANALQTAATGRAMLVAGRLIMGLGQGCATFTVPMYLSEMSPAAVRGRFGTMYSISTTVGQALGYAINQAVHASGVAQSWRIPFAAAAWCPLAMLLLMVFVLPDTPSSLLQRQRHAAARAAFELVRHRSSQGREQEWQAMMDEEAREQHCRQHQLQQQQQQPAAAVAAAVQTTAMADGQHDSSKGTSTSSCNHNVMIVGESSANHHCSSSSNSIAKATDLGTQQQQQQQQAPWAAYVITLHLSAVRVWNGFVTVMFFSAVLFNSTGNSISMSLLAQTLMGVCTLLGGLVALSGIDRIGRQPLLTWFGVLMAAAMAAAAAILGTGLPAAAVAAGRRLSPQLTGALLAVLCLWQLAYWSSWAPCFYVMMSELYPLRARATAVGCGMIVFNLNTFLVLFLGTKMLCAMQHWMLVFYTAVDLYLAAFAALCMPETKGMPLQEVGELYRGHWLWRHTYRIHGRPM